MGLICTCPAGVEIADVPISDCPESFGQLQKVAFQRLNSAPGVKNAIANPLLLASWSPLLAASDSTKVVQSPFIQAPATEPGAARSYGGGNETLGGVEIITGREPTSFSGNILQSSQLTIKALKTYQCEGVGVILIDEYGRLGMIADDPTTPTEYYPIPINGLFIGDKSLGGLESPDMNAIMWKFFPNWSDNFKILTPTDFDALTELVTP